MLSDLTLRTLRREDENALTWLLEANDLPEVTRWFDPFPLTAATARALCNAEGRDLYWGAWQGQALVGLAMVRGWDGGHPEPAFGCLVDSRYQGRGIGSAVSRLMCLELTRRGVAEVRARVHAGNVASLRMLQRAGFEELSRDAERVLLAATLGA